VRNVLVFAMILAVLLAGQPVQAGPLNQPVVPGTPKVEAESFVLMDAQSGQILSQRNADEHLAMASITKIMTAVVALEKGNPDADVSVGPAVLDRKRVYGTLIFLERGEKFTLRDMLYALLMDSANDAAVAIAENISGNVDDFVKLMNDKAKELGANDTHFTNPHGLSEVGHYSSARDMAVIARYALQKPEFAAIVKTKERAFPRARPGLPNELQNHNKLLWRYPDADGVKTGYTDQAGHTLVASATRNGRQLITVILKGTAIATVYRNAGELFDYGFSQFQDKLLAKKGQVFQTAKLANGTLLKLAPDRDVYGTLANEDKAEFELKAEAQKLDLPIKAGEERGTLEVYLRGKLLQRIPLVATQDLALPAANVPSHSKVGMQWLLAVPIILVFSLGMRFIQHKQRRARRRSSRWTAWNGD